METDVIRWSEGVSQPSHWGPRGGRVQLGNRTIVAQVMTDARNLAGEVELRVIASEGKYPLHKDEQVMRRRRAISTGETERLEWSDEEAREAVLESVPPVHEGQAVYSHGQGDSTVAPEYGGGKGRGGGHRTGPIWNHKPRQRNAPGM
ncbi:MAG: hypothetical protein KDC18_02965 [Alphaproteobacteria bacterium]|nr:hypothetical protein [Alphaproteobacteria bacterium]